MPDARDLLIVGAGPAGRALSKRAADAGLDVLVVDAAPTARWKATYGAWADELPSWLPSDCIAAQSDYAVVFTPTRRIVHRPYVILDTPTLQDAVTSDRVTVKVGRATTIARNAVLLDSGERLRATTVIDIRGTQSPGAGARQTAVGVRRPSPQDHGDTMVIMDWRQSGTAGVAPTFNYRVRLDPTTTLVEETSLAALPPIPFDVLAARLATRCDLPLPDISGSDPTVELVDFAMLPTGQPWKSSDGPFRFGAAGGFMHPATGFSVATTLTAVDEVVFALTSHRDLHDVLWPPRAKLVYRLRRAGLHVLLGFDADQLTTFFDAFFSLDVGLQRAYLSDRHNLAGHLRAMSAVFHELPMGLRLVLAQRFIRALATA